MFEEMEKEVIGLILRNEPTLGKQNENIRIIKREFTGVGFFSYFEGYNDNSNTQISNVGAILNDSIHVGFTLFANEGKLNFLEGYTYDEPWPKSIKTYKIFLE